VKKISLVRDTIDDKDVESLIEWLKTNPRLTKGDITKEFEKKWSEWQGRKYSVYVNSGSSANLAMIYALLQSKKLSNKNIIVPAVSWATTVAPVIQLGMKPILCECDEDTLGLDIVHLKELIKEHKPSALMLVHVLAFPNKMKEILEICEENDVLLLEDSCESIGSEYDGIKTGNFGLMSSFSLYFGHHISTIEGGFVCTDDFDLYRILLSIRSHGWDRDLDVNFQVEKRNEYEVSDFKSLYTFYYPGFNLRSTDLQAFIGLGQIDKLDNILEKRERNFSLYDKYIKNDYWKIKKLDNCFYSNFAYPIIHPDREEIAKHLMENDVECRPLVCGSIGKQPFWKDIYGEQSLEFADKVDDFGLYLPNHPNLTEQDIKYVCDLVNEKISE
jgi:CDP-6-deoxy-D-xylo-4-hexulose-3-dehydrase